MLTLHYARGASSGAPHILLEESGEPYRLHHVELAAGEQLQPAYLAINPHGRVPALTLDSGETIAEVLAILHYLGQRYGTWPAAPAESLRALALLSWFETTVHQTNIRVVRPQRFVSDPAAQPDVKATAIRDYHEQMREIDRHYAGRDWLCGAWSPLDPLAFVFYVWGLRRQLPMAELAHFTGAVERMKARPAVASVIAEEKLPV